MLSLFTSLVSLYKVPPLLLSNSADPAPSEVITSTPTFFLRFYGDSTKTQLGLIGPCPRGPCPTAELSVLQGRCSGVCQKPSSLVSIVRKTRGAATGHFICHAHQRQLRSEQADQTCHRFPLALKPTQASESALCGSSASLSFLLFAKAETPSISTVTV